MSFECYSCGKKRMVGNNVSHANNRNKRVFKPNLQPMKIIVNKGVKKVKVCTRCLRSGKVQKAI